MDKAPPGIMVELCATGRKEDHLTRDTGGELEAFGATLAVPTVSSLPAEDIDPAPFLRLHDVLEERYPRVHGVMSRETVAGCSLLYTWPGADDRLLPVMLTAHLDVVPPGDLYAWPHPPFSGALREGRVWGRGAVDYKVGVAGMLQACENLLSEGFAPRRTILLAMGHDEEVGGLLGAGAVTRLLLSRRVSCRSLLDEGGYLMTYPWLDGDVAVVGLAEKGYMTVRLTCRGSRAHASRPPSRTVAGILCRAVADLEQTPMPVSPPEPVLRMLEATSDMLAPELGGASGDGEALAEAVARWPEGNALVRTTMAPTVLAGADRENVLPSEAHALVNVRPTPGCTVHDVMEHIRGVTEPLGVTASLEDPRKVREASGVSPEEAEEYRAIVETARTVWPGLPVAPGIFPAATDSSHYRRAAERVYRFVPVPLGGEGMGVLHSEGESLGAEDYLRAVGFYAGYLRRVAGGGEG